jgi:hypothetical protein
MPILPWVSRRRSFLRPLSRLACRKTIFFGWTRACRTIHWTMIGTSTRQLTVPECRQVLDDLVASVTAELRAFLTTIWDRYRKVFPDQAHQGRDAAAMPLRDLMRVTNTDKDHLLEILQPLGGSVVTLKGYSSQQSWELRGPALFLLLRAREHKRYLVESLRSAKRRSFEDPPPPFVTMSELLSDLELPPDDTNELVAVVSLSRFLNVNRIAQGDWAIQFPNDIDDLSRNADFEGYVLQSVFGFFEQDLPVQEYLQQDFRNRRAQLDQSSEGFWFVEDRQLKRWLAADWLEVEAGLRNNAHRSSTILCRSILEWLLLDALSVDAAAAKATYAHLKGWDPKKKVVTLDKWMLQDLLDVAGHVGVLPPHEVKLGAIVQEYGNRVHFGMQLRKSVEITPDGAALTANALRECIRALDVRARKKISVQTSSAL